MDPQRIRAIVASARVARLATVSADGRPHLVPVCFVAVGEVVYTAVDHKPKRGTTLRRIANIQATGRACLLVDHYSEDWSELYWVRLDGSGRVVTDPDERRHAVSALVGKYEQYADRPPTGMVLAVDVQRRTGWAASAG